MLGAKRHYEAVIAAQSKHIERLNDMVSQLFNALMLVNEKPAGIVLTEKKPEAVVQGRTEPEPGDLFDPINVKGMP